MAAVYPATLRTGQGDIENADNLNWVDIVPVSANDGVITEIFISTDELVGEVVILGIDDGVNQYPILSETLPGVVTYGINGLNATNNPALGVEPYPQVKLEAGQKLIAKMAVQLAAGKFVWIAAAGYDY